MLVDSHCHLDYLEEERHGLVVDEVLARAAAAGVGHMLSVSVDRQNMPRVLAHAARYPQVSASVGIHPGACADDAPVDEAELLRFAASPKVVAIGETGLDYHYGRDSAERQRASFAVHLRAASRAGLPVIVHTREASADTLRLMAEFADTRHAGVMHCFTESLEVALAAIDMNFCISFSGIVSFRNADSLRDVARRIPAERLLVETDAPYLAPAPHRGRCNEPALVSRVAEVVAELRGLSVQALAEITTANFQRLFPRAILGT
jgi:TatD DNase family protein